MSTHSDINEYAATVSEMGTHESTAQRVATQYEAHMSLFGVAAANEDDDDMEKTRATLHGLLDTMLDACMSLGKLQAKAKALLKRLPQQ